MIHLVADSHFGDLGCLIHRHRPFVDVAEMNETIVANWNSIVSPTDIVYHLGDFATSDEAVEEFAPRLNGEIHLLVGNHEVPRDRELLERSFAEVIEDPFEFHVPESDQKLWFCHYPKQRHPSLKTVTGHVHDLNKSWIDMLNCGLDAWHFRPIPLGWALDHFKSQDEGRFDANVYADAPIEWQWEISTIRERSAWEPTLPILRAEMAQRKV